MRHVASSLTLTLFFATTVGCAGGTPSPTAPEPVRSTPATPSKSRPRASPPATRASTPTPRRMRNV
jgi:hypothetical protein